jgi:hypothetical protein
MNNRLLLFFMFLLFICYNRDYYESYESYQNYQNNNGSGLKPDSTQFYSCDHSKFENDTEYPFEKYPPNNYIVKKNQVSLPLKGAYSSFIDVNEIRTYDHFYHSPICENPYGFEENLDVQFRLIPGAFPEEDISVIYEEELEKDKEFLKDPDYLYGNPKFIQNKILYDDELQDKFLEVKDRTISRFIENAVHYDDIESPYGP